MYVWDSNPLFNGDVQVGIANGRCIVLEDTTDSDNLYCLIEWVFDGQGSITFQGVFIQLIATGGTGCFEDVRGFIEPVEDDPLGFGYNFVYQTDSADCVDAASLIASPWTEGGGDTYIDWDGNGYSVSRQLAKNISRIV